MNISNIVIEKINKYLDSKVEEDLNLNQQFLEVGINSVKFIEIIVGLEQELNIEYEDKILMLGSLNNISSFMEYTLKKYTSNN